MLAHHPNFNSNLIPNIMFELNNLGIIIVTEEIGWGVVPASRIGHLFRERLSNLSSLVFKYSSQKWLAINGIAIDLDKVGNLIP